VTFYICPLPDDAQRRILIFNEAECESTGSGFFELKQPDCHCESPIYRGEAIYKN
jgi:hypothetical protein